MSNKEPTAAEIFEREEELKELINNNCNEEAQEEFCTILEKIIRKLHILI